MGMVIGVLVALVVFVALYVFFCYCLKLIVEKTGNEPGIFIWIPILQLIPMLKAAGLPIWVLVLFFVPCVGVLAGLFMWWKICEARGKGILGFLLVVLLAPIGIIYLAFTD